MDSDSATQEMIQSATLSDIFYEILNFNKMRNKKIISDREKKIVPKKNQYKK